MKTYKEKIEGLSRWPGDSFDDCRAIASGIAEAADAEIAQLKAERDALLKDAERYRIVRNRELGFAVQHAVPGWKTGITHGQLLDVAIDIAMASSSKEGK